MKQTVPALIVLALVTVYIYELEVVLRLTIHAVCYQVATGAPVSGTSMIQTRYYMYISTATGLHL